LPHQSEETLQHNQDKIPECNHKVTGNGCEAVDGREAQIGLKAKNLPEHEHRQRICSNNFW